VDRLIYTAMTGASQTMERLAAVAHNLANVDSTGYRAEEHQLRAVQVEAQGASSSTALPTRAFVVDASTHTDFTPGPMQYTARTLDVAVRGSGWIALAMPDGSEAYTRNGSLQLSLDGVLQTRSGIPVQSDSGPIAIPPDQSITIGTDGTVSVVPLTGAQNSVNTIGRVKLVDPPSGDLVRGADDLFRMKTGTPATSDDNIKLDNGYLEGSNVNPVDAMVNMISLGRQFEMQMKMISMADANDQAATKVLSS
jgi:flagellar basal-body rod protein FlgF